MRGGVPPPLFVFAGLWIVEAPPGREEERRAPIRERGAEDCGGAGGPSTVKGKTEIVKNFLEMKCFSLPPHARLGDALKGASPGLGGGGNPCFCIVSCWQNVKICEGLLEMPSFQSLAGRWARRCTKRRVAWPCRRRQPFFSVSYRVGKTLKSVKICLECLVFNALGAAACRPQSLAGRWAGRRTERCVAWPWRRRQCKFFVSYRVDKMLKSVSVFLKCVVLIALAVAMYHPHQIVRRWAGRCAKRCVAWPWRRRQSFFLYRIVLTKR